MPQLPSYVCEYTEMVCQYSDLVCQAYPESCWYVTVACTNLSLLCDSAITVNDESKIKDILKRNNDLMKIFLKQNKDK